SICAVPGRRCPTCFPYTTLFRSYNVQMFFNGNAAAGLTIDLTGTVAPGEVFVLAHASSVQAILEEADMTSGAGLFNGDDAVVLRSEEHTSELQSRENLVCRLRLE